MKRIIAAAILFCSLIVASCKKNTEEFITPSISDYAPLSVGKYITYQLDSLVFKDFGTTRTIVSYQVKHEVSESIKDNLSRPAYRITRYIRKSAQNPWVPDNSFMAINTGSSLEFIENNMRFLKLKMPVKNDFTWKGNSFIDTYSLNSKVRYLDNWDYVYEEVNTPFIAGQTSIDSTIKINQRDEIIGNPADANSYSEENSGIEIYAKGIGLVYRKFLHTEFQPATPGTRAAYSDDSYGITLTMTGHN